MPDRRKPVSLECTGVYRRNHVLRFPARNQMRRASREELGGFPKGPGWRQRGRSG